MFASDAHGRLYAASQVTDYALRGMAFEYLNYLEFTLRARE